MKRILGSIILLYGSFAYASLSVSQIEAMVKQIHLKRKGVSLDVLDKTKEPFVKLKKDEKTDTVVVELPKTDLDDVKISLHAIMGDKAFLNDEWKKVGDRIMGYEVKYIGKRGVVLQSGNKIKTLFFGHANKEKLFTLNERD